MTRTVLAPVIAALLVVGLGACQAEKDLGQTCKMTRPNPIAGEAPIELEADQVADGSFDYMAFGAAECDDLVCLRTSGSANPENEEGRARGYCSAPCIDASDCDPDYLGNKGTMRCEQVLPDQEFLDALRRSDPETYEKTFGSGAAAKYCVLPRTAK